MVTEPELAFAVQTGDALEVRVNFGVFAGRDVTNAEIDRLARRLAQDVEEFSIVSERRNDFARGIETSLHLVRIELGRATVDADQMIEIAEAWAADCIADRHAEIAEL